MPLRQAVGLEPADPAVGERLAKLVEKPRFPQAGLADDTDDLTAAGLDLRQPIAQDAELALAPDKRAQPALRVGLGAKRLVELISRRLRQRPRPVTL